MGVRPWGIVKNWVYCGPAAVLYIISALWIDTYPDWAVEAGL